MIKDYHKLVRDNIPSIIEKDGKTCRVVTLSQEECLSALRAKLLEEMKEYQESFDIEELTDLQEVINAIVHESGLTLEQFDVIRKKKEATNGGFKKRLMLLSVDDHKN